ncbi:MAG: hypothetical protein ACJ71R_23510 [Nitrososphaeraceae archaeon]
MQITARAKVISSNGDGHGVNDTSTSANITLEPEPREIKILSVGEAKMLHSGIVSVYDKVVGFTNVRKLIASVTYTCTQCNNTMKITYPKPVSSITYAKKDYLSNSSDSYMKCPREECKDSKSSRMVIKNRKQDVENCNAAYIELQEVDSNNSLDQLSALVTEDAISIVNRNQEVIITGEITIGTKDNNFNGPRIAILVVKHVQYIRKESYNLSNEDIRKINRFKHVTEQIKHQDIIKTLVPMFCPWIIDEEFSKQALLLAAANSGIMPLDNEGYPTRKRLRINLPISLDNPYKEPKTLKIYNRELYNIFSSSQEKVDKRLYATIVKT